MSRARRSLAAAVIAVVALSSGARAQSALFGDFSLTSNDDPVEIVSDTLEFDAANQKAVFEGGVEVTQGDIRLESDVLNVDYADVEGAQELREVVATGNVRIHQGKRRARGDRVEFNMLDDAKRVLVLTGNAVLEEGSNTISGDTIEVFPDESRMEVKGQNRRVKVILFPDDSGSALPDGAGNEAKPAPEAEGGSGEPDAEP